MSSSPSEMAGAQGSAGPTINLRCHQCALQTEVPLEHIPRYGARVRCPECGTLQLLAGAPTVSEGLKAPAPSAEVITKAQSPPDRAIEVLPDPAAAREEAKQILLLWLQELHRGRDGPLSESALFQEHGDELAHLFTLWKSSFPGEQATEIFREQLFRALAGTAADPPLRGS